MTNIERQRSLNKKRTRENLGMMPYCSYCSHKRIVPLTIHVESNLSIPLHSVYSSQHDTCWATQISRDNECLCAKAYNRMIRKNAIRTKNNDINEGGDYNDK